MFPFYRGNPPPVLVGVASFFISSYEKERRSCELLPPAAGSFSGCGFCITASFYAICELAIGVPLAAACLTRSSNIKDAILLPSGKTRFASKFIVCAGLPDCSKFHLQ